MRRSTLGSLCALGGFLLGSGCADRVAGGTTETDNMLSARVFSVDSLLEGWNRPTNGPTIAVLRLDSSHLDFGRTSLSGADLRVEALDSTPLPFRIVYWDREAALGRLQVRLEEGRQRPGSRIRLRWGLRDSVRADSVAVWRGISEPRTLDLNSVLVSDFEQGSLLSLLPHPGLWITNAGGTAKVSSPSVGAAGAGRGGQALVVTFEAPILTGWALAKVPLGPAAYNLRSLDSIEFWARGTNSIVTVAFDQQGGGDRKAWTRVDPDSTWRRFAIRPSDLDSATGNGGNVGWLGVRDSVTHLSFFIAQGSEVRFDDIRLHGIDRGDLK